MRSVLVVLLAVDAEHVLDMPSAEDHDSVEAVRANRANPALGVGIRVRRLDRRADHSDAFGPEDLIEGMAELRVTVVDEEPERLLLTEANASARIAPKSGGGSIRAAATSWAPDTTRSARPLSGHYIPAA